MVKGSNSRVSNDSQTEDYYACEDIARSYFDFGVPRKLAVQWICAKLNVSEEISERACDYVYFKSNY